MLAVLSLQELPGNQRNADVARALPGIKQSSASRERVKANIPHSGMYSGRLHGPMCVNFVKR